MIHAPIAACHSPSWNWVSRPAARDSKLGTGRCLLCLLLAALLSRRLQTTFSQLLQAQGDRLQGGESRSSNCE